MTVKLSQLRYHKGVAGQYSYTVLATYDGEEPGVLEFVGSVYGGPVIMVTRPNGREVQTFVDDPGRFGAKLDPGWVRNFFSLD